MAIELVKRLMPIAKTTQRAQHKGRKMPLKVFCKSPHMKIK